jgi:phosphatidylserine decarboxylase
MLIAKEGLREIAIATLILGAFAAAGAWLLWPLAIPFVLLWLWVLSFFRDPKRERCFAPGELCAPADGTVTEVTELDAYEGIDGPASRIGIFLSLFNVHINRAPCPGRVRSVSHLPGVFLDARHGESGRRNESNTLVIDPDDPMPGPVVVRQVAGLLARRIVCHARADHHLPMGARFGLIKFGSRTELIIPRRARTEIRVKVGDKVRAGLTVVARQQIEAADG